MTKRDRVLKLLESAGLADKEVLATTHHARVRLALGRDESLIKDAIIWLCNGDPGRAYAHDPSLRPLLNNLYPGLKDIWQRLGEEHEKDDKG